MTALTLLPDNAVVENHGALKTTSLKVAEAFGKRHDDVLRKLKGIDCSEEFNARNFAVVDYLDKKGEFRKAYQMTKDGFMFLVMGFTGKKAAAIKEAYINAFNQMANQLKRSVPITSPTPQLSFKPHHYDSGWTPACWQRSSTHMRCAWVHHVRVVIKPHPYKDRLIGKIILGIGGEGESLPTHDTEKGIYQGQGYEYQYRNIDELWEILREVLVMMSARLPY